MYMCETLPNEKYHYPIIDYVYISIIVMSHAVLLIRVFFNSFSLHYTCTGRRQTGLNGFGDDRDQLVGVSKCVVTKVSG